MFWPCYRRAWRFMPLTTILIGVCAGEVCAAVAFLGIRKPLGGCAHTMAGGDNAKRLEFRLPGADANPYLAATAILAGVHWGISQNLCPPQELSGEYRGAAQYPISWRGALDALSQAEILPRYINKDFIKNYLTVKENEWRHHRDQVSEYDITRYGAVI